MINFSYHRNLVEKKKMVKTSSLKSEVLFGPQVCNLRQFALSTFRVLEEFTYDED